MNYYIDCWIFVEYEGESYNIALTKTNNAKQQMELYIQSHEPEKESILIDNPALLEKLLNMIEE
jgi:hypothetical protein